MERDPVMIVDDDADVREMLGQMLELEGYPVITASDGADALQKLDGEPLPLAILLDLRMPGMNGWEFRALQLRDERLSAIPVLVVSADRTTPNEHLEDLRAVAFLRKPIDVDRLLEQLQRLEYPRVAWPSGPDAHPPAP
jgi:CheY-like chemotaxis protein